LNYATYIFSLLKCVYTSETSVPVRLLALSRSTELYRQVVQLLSHVGIHLHSTQCEIVCTSEVALLLPAWPRAQWFSSVSESKVYQGRPQRIFMINSNKSEVREFKLLLNYVA